jgi:ribosomal-protein-serine acetyltransferase
MRVTFPRLPDYERAYSLVERDDGVVYQLHGGVAGSRLPHDIVHLVVERELHIRDGIWGGIAAGAVYSSMTHVSGRRPPHANERSKRLLSQRRQQGLRAELMADLVAATAGLDAPTSQQIRVLAATKLSVLPDAEVDPAAVAAAARALQVEAARWARLRVGEHLDYEWPARTRTTHSRTTRGAAVNTSPPEVIESGILTLRRWRPDDAGVLYRLVDESMDHLSPWLPWAPGYSRESAAEFIGMAAENWAAGRAYSYAMTVAGEIVGGAGLHGQAEPDRMEIGYWVHRAHTRRGLATAASAALTEQAFLLPGISQVEIYHDPRNLASAGVPRKLGFTKLPEQKMSADGHLYTVWCRLAGADAGTAV